MSQKRVVKRNKSALKPTTIALYASIFTVILTVVAAGYKSPQTASVASVNVIADEAELHQTSVNEVVATTLVADVAESANLSIAANVANLSVSLALKSDIVATDSGESISKQQIVQATGTRQDVVTHVVKSGDTVDSVAANYGVSEKTIRWANDLIGSSLNTGDKIIIPPVDGVVHEVKGGDTPATLAKKYNTSEQRIIAFNNLELAGMKKGQKVVIPAGTLPESERPGYTPPAAATPSPTANYGFTYRPGSVGNRYAPGWCTWYVFERRPDIGSFWGNANTWDSSARAAGYTVVRGVPKAGAIFQYGSGGYGGGYGHVGIVESVNEAAGTMVVSDMNGIAGWNQVGTKTVPINAGWNYIYNR